MERSKSDTLVGLLQSYLQAHPNKKAFIFLGEDNSEQDALTYKELDCKAKVLASQLLKSAQPGDRAMLLFPSGLEFITAFFACEYAGIIPVPMLPPRNRRLRDSVFSVAYDCQPKIGLTVSILLDFIQAQFTELAEFRTVNFLTVDTISTSDTIEFSPYQPIQDEIAFLQYTSGSTSAPKGVIVNHRNLMANLKMQKIAFENNSESTYVGWAPLYHDMGLIANVLEPFYLGGLCVLMSPSSFAQSPWLWFQAISDYRARVSGGPNFAYDLCISRRDRILKRQQQLDLSCWQIAFNSAEPVRAATLNNFANAFVCIGFRQEAFYPCFGMAEATLLISGGSPHTFPIVKRISKIALAQHKVKPPKDVSDEMVVVACGKALVGETIKIVDPQTHLSCKDGCIGEIWVSGPHIPEGYWCKTTESQETFKAKADGIADILYLRTGDLGYIDKGELYVTGRMKDLIIIHGRNFYPQDIERIAESAYLGLKINSGAAFLVTKEAQEVIVLVQEVERTARRSINQQEAIAAIRQAVFQEFEVTLSSVILVETSSIPKTSSGKIRRVETRKRYLEGTLDYLKQHNSKVDSIEHEKIVSAQ